MVKASVSLTVDFFTNSSKNRAAGDSSAYFCAQFGWKKQSMCIQLYELCANGTSCKLKCALFESGKND